MQNRIIALIVGTMLTIPCMHANISQIIHDTNQQRIAREQCLQAQASLAIIKNLLDQCTNETCNAELTLMQAQYEAIIAQFYPLIQY